MSEKFSNTKQSRQLLKPKFLRVYQTRPAIVVGEEKQITHDAARVRKQGEEEGFRRIHTKTQPSDIRASRDHQYESEVICEILQFGMTDQHVRHVAQSI